MIRRIGSICFAFMAMLGVFSSEVNIQAQTPASQAPTVVAPGKPAPAQRPLTHAAPVTSVSVDGSEAMFTTMCALYASGYEGDINADHWSTFRAQMREKMRQQKGPAVEAVREFYQQHNLKDPGAMLSRYVWFGLVSGPAPKFQPVLRRDELPPEVIELEGFSELLSSYYVEQNIGQLWRQVQPVYNRDIEQLHESISQIVLVCTAYLRELSNVNDPRTFTIIVEPLVGRITNVRNYADHYAIILSGGEDIPTDVVRHAYLHFLLDPLPLMYSHVVVVKRPLYELAAKAPRLPEDLREDYFSWFSECLVRAVELKLKKMSPGEKEAVLVSDDESGYVMVRTLFNALPGYEKNEPSMKNYFPDMVRGIDLKVEGARIAAIKFAPAGKQYAAEGLNKEDLARRRAAAVTTVPYDQEMIVALTNGERQIAEKNPRAAEASFKTVLAKYPDQIRAWYGMGLVALLDHDGPRAKQVFGRLTTGEHAAMEDPMVLSWSHVYLGRVLEDEGELARAKTEYQAAIDVQGAPSQAQLAAKRGLGDLETRKPAERP
jgi:tetratricopeptide (TPR) repeat protein